MILVVHESVEVRKKLARHIGEHLDHEVYEAWDRGTTTHELDNQHIRIMVISASLPDYNEIFRMSMRCDPDLRLIVLFAGLADPSVGPREVLHIGVDAIVDSLRIDRLPSLIKDMLAD